MTDLSSPEDTFVIERLDQLKALTHPLRQQLFERFAAEPATTKQAAVQLGYKPTRLYHHVATLEKAGLIEVVKTRPNRGTTEKYYSSVARRLKVDSSVLGRGSSAAAAGAARLELVEGILKNVRDDLADLLASDAVDCNDRQEEAFFIQAEVRGTPERIEAIRNKLNAFVEELSPQGEQDDHPDRDKYRLVIGWYPGADNNR